MLSVPEPVDLTVRRSQHHNPSELDQLYTKWTNYLLQERCNFPPPQGVTRSPRLRSPRHTPAYQTPYPPSNMTLDSYTRCCSICFQSSGLIHSHSSTFPRILKALDMNSMDASPRQREQLSGLCARCEKDIRGIEEAQSLKHRLRDVFTSSLQRIGLFETKSSISPLYLPPAFQQYNEVTPFHQTTKRKIPTPTQTDGAPPVNRRKQLKTQITHALPISPTSNTALSSDDEAPLIIAEPNTRSIHSPTSSRGTPTPPPSREGQRPDDSVNGDTDATLAQSGSQICDSVSPSRKRRKQARPSKAAPVHLPLPGSDPPATPTTDPVTQTPTQPAAVTPTAPSAVSSPMMLFATSAPVATAAPAVTSAMSAPAAMIHSAFPQLPLASPAGGLFASQQKAGVGLSALFGGGLTALMSGGVKKEPNKENTPTGRAALQQQQQQKQQQQQQHNIFTSVPSAASSCHSKLNHNKDIPTSMDKPTNKSTTQNISTGPSVSPAPLTPSASPSSSLSSSFNGCGKHIGLNVPPDQHVLLKTEKRRYCKVCAGASRKANNGRPPQSRFLCSVCCVPMCRSCIEEHRYRIAMKLDEGEPVKMDSRNLPSKSTPTSSASARLLQAVKMKDKASSKPRNKPTKPAEPRLPMYHHSTPTSNTSMLYNQLSLSQLQNAALKHFPFMPALPGFAPPFSLSAMMPSMPVDMSLSMNNLKPIAPAPPKLVNMTSQQIKLESGLSKEGENAPLDVTGDSIGVADVTAEMASKTAEMLANLGEDNSTKSTEQTARSTLNPFHIERSSATCSNTNSLADNAFLPPGTSERAATLDFSRNKVEDEKFFENNPPSSNRTASSADALRNGEASITSSQDSKSIAAF